MVVLVRDMARGCGIAVCMGHGAGIGQLVVGTIIGGGIVGLMSPVHELVWSNDFVMGLRLHHNKSGTFKVKVHSPFTHDLCSQ